jgi:hemolysin III
MIRIRGDVLPLNSSDPGSGSLKAADERRKTPGEIDWRYSIAELRADGAIHAVGLALIPVGWVALLAVQAGPSFAATAAYLLSLSLSFIASAAYNIWPVSRVKWLLRRIDQSAIYLLIAGTYTPFLATVGAWRSLMAVWAVAIVGVALRLWRPGQFDRLSIVLYLLLGWSGVLMLGQIVALLPASTPWLIATGGVIYSIGVIFHVWSRLRFQNAIWHGFVLAAASIHYVAVWTVVTATA